jgi:hypothetical protein
MAGNSVAAIMGLEFPHLHAIALKRRDYPTSPGPTSVFLPSFQMIATARFRAAFLLIENAIEQFRVQDGVSYSLGHIGSGNFKPVPSIADGRPLGPHA